MGAVVLLALNRGALRPWRLGRGQWLRLGVISLSGVLGQQLMQAYALRHTSANHGGWILAATPIVVGAAMAAFFRERMGRLRWAGLLLGACGALLVFLSRQTVGGAVVPTLRGDAIFLASCGNWALYVILMDRWLKELPQRRITALSMACGLVLSAALCLATGHGRELARVSFPGWACLAYLGLLSSGLGYFFWNNGVEALGPSAAAAFLYLEPLAALGTGRVMLGEAVAPAAVLGGLLILGGVALVNAGRRLPAAPEEAA